MQNYTASRTTFQSRPSAAWPFSSEEKQMYLLVLTKIDILRLER